MEKVGLLVVMGCEDDVVDDALEDLVQVLSVEVVGSTRLVRTYGMKLIGIILDGLSV